jgi:N-acetylglucosamine-6-phosphate deacetylase
MRITGGTLITPFETLTDRDLVIEGGTISAIAPPVSAAAPDTIDARGLFVAPGMIDVHVHGGDGHDTMDATPDALYGMARFFARHGVTAYYPTTMTAPPAAILAAVENVRRCPQPMDGAQHLGVHIEGPYLSPKHPGAQPASALRDADPAEYAAWLASGVVRLITAAPERSGVLALIEAGLDQGVEFALGHTDATYAQVIEAADRGVRQATHTFNAMVGLHHREPGTVGGVLADDRLYAQVIVDGIHVHPAVVKVLVRAKGPGRTLLITDAMRAAGLPDGEYDLGGQPITVRGGVARTPGGALAGSTATLDAVLRNVAAFAGLTLAEALPMATSTPAEAMGLAGRKGVLAPGADADVILLDAGGHVRLTMVAGRVVYRA